ncbi:hypothetical protein P4050_16540 [Pseudomonas aeruginosa]|nr:hypothetical protein [Pseudomonas aeruginosa]
MLHSATGALMWPLRRRQSAEQTLDAIRAGLESLATSTHAASAQAKPLNWTLGGGDGEVINCRRYCARLDERFH